MLFTASDFGVAGPVGMVALPAFVLLLAIAWLTHPVEIPSLLSRGLALAPPVPSPQG